MSRIDCILYPPTLDYNYLVQRPQQLMKNFAELGIPTFFLNEPSPGKSQERRIEKGNSNLYIFNHVDPQPYLKNTRPIVYFSAAWHIDMVHQYNPALVVFDSVDEPSDEFEAWKPYYFRAVSLADIVLNTSDKLYEMSRTINPHSYLVPNGCDYEFFSQAAGRQLLVPDDIAHIPGPIIGYIGVVASWLDMKLIQRLAQQFPHCNVVMIGPLYNVNQIPRQPNLHWLGFKPYEQLAAYAQCFDVGIIPFIQSNMVDAVNPIKMWEYMASGIPVVSTAIPEARKYPELILYSGNSDEFLSNVQQALYQDSPEMRTRRMAIAEQNSWRHRAQQVVEIIEQRLEEKNHLSQERDALFFDAQMAQGIAPHTGHITQIISKHRRLSFSTRIPLRISVRGYVPSRGWGGQGVIAGVKGIRFQCQTTFRYRTAKIN